MNGTLKHLYQNILNCNRNVKYKNNIITIKHRNYDSFYTTKYLIKVYDGRIICIGTFYDNEEFL
jgi:hypothetical protein